VLAPAAVEVMHEVGLVPLPLGALAPLVPLEDPVPGYRYGYGYGATACVSAL
jgi:hypothetical protein